MIVNEADWILSPAQYVAFMVSTGQTREKAEAIMREKYKECHGVYPEEHRPDGSESLFGIKTMPYTVVL